MMTEEIRAKKEVLIEESYKRGLEALQQHSVSTGMDKERAYSRFIEARNELIAMQKAFCELDGELSDYCCTLGLDLGNQMIEFCQKELAA
ncbi:hypothetical protein SAMN05216429_106136 [Marinobacter persicus]|uniref:Uncharacterized protein n=1 Tax=Marinobacter persicus TaxID=930118 RepID=A0A1I3UIR4_9GAMM|nr:hypothetical protein [Marinobacter persicus]GHD52484.1 hypothetical protein GCM10008110_25340 [Marinobacter persicus]SFJ82589.1 hypothetical protein SAMN05216429_106136 [Marinobacter persicus]